MLEIKRECTFDVLRDVVWSGAVETVKTIIEAEKTDELMQLLEDIFYEPTDIMIINDFLWFDRDYIYETLEIEED